MYKKYINSETGELSPYIIKEVDNRQYYVPNDPDNTEWQRYQAWLAEDENNQPEPAE